MQFLYFLIVKLGTSRDDPKKCLKINYPTSTTVSFELFFSKFIFKNSSTMFDEPSLL